MSPLHQAYDELWQRALGTYQQGMVVLDPVLPDKSQDTRRGLTLKCKLPAAAQAAIQDFLHEFDEVCPGQYLYPSSDLHLTILTIISCQADFELAQSRWEEYWALIQAAIADLPAFRMAFHGITASPSCVLAQGFPLGEGLELLRNRIRAAFSASHLPHTIDKRYFLNTAHSTIVRYTEAPQDLKATVQFLEKQRKRPLGMGKIQEIEFVCTDWYMSEGIVTELASWPLNGKG
ncbi:MAG: hypothetical protein AAF399_09565 [Bacteroidota bacterium]